MLHLCGANPASRVTGLCKCLGYRFPLALSVQDAHSQGEVVACLEKGLVKEAEETDPRVQVSDQCKKAILRVAELSSDDFHLDRHLYFACRDDRERFCENVSSFLQPSLKINKKKESIGNGSEMVERSLSKIM